MPETGLTYATLCAVAVGLLWCGIGIVISKVTSRGADFAHFMAGNYAVSALLASILFPRHAVLFTETVPQLPATVCILLVAGLLSSAGLLVMNRAMKRGPHGASWAIAQSALVVPFTTGVLLWDDQATVPNLFGVAIVLTALVAFAMARTEASSDTAAYSNTWFVLALAALLLLGLQQTLVTIPSRWPGWTDAARIRIPLVALGSAIGYTIAAARTRGPSLFRLRKTSLIMPCIALPSQLLLFLALDISAEHGRTGLVYPLAVGTCIVSFAVYSVAVLKEPLSRYTLAGMVLGAVGVVLVAVK